MGFKISKKSDFIKEFTLVDYNTSKKVVYKLNHLKLLTYLFYSLQKKLVQNDPSIKDISNAILIKDNDIYMVFDGIVYETAKIRLDIKEFIEFMGFSKDNYIKKTKELLVSFMQTVIEIKTRDFNSVISIMPKVNFIKPEGKRDYIIDITLSAGFVYEVLEINSQFAKIDVKDVTKLKSKYSVRLYEEFERIIQNTNGGNSFIKSKDNLNKFFNTDFDQDSLHKIILRAKDEIEFRNYFRFTYEKIKNENREWIFKITNIEKIQRIDEKILNDIL